MKMRRVSLYDRDDEHEMSRDLNIHHCVPDLHVRGAVVWLSRGVAELDRVVVV